MDHLYVVVMENVPIVCEGREHSCCWLRVNQILYVEKNYNGKWIEALVDWPNGGAVLKGEIAQIYNTDQANFPSQKNYRVTLSTIGTKFKLLPDGYKTPVKEFKGWRIGDPFIVKKDNLNYSCLKKETIYYICEFHLDGSKPHVSSSEDPGGPSIDQGNVFVEYLYTPEDKEYGEIAVKPSSEKRIKPTLLEPLSVKRRAII